MDRLWDDIAATAVFSIQLYESYKHFHVFNQYLHRVGYDPIEDEEIAAIRRRNLGLRYEDGTRLLTHYMMSEHFAAFHFMKDAKLAREPVLRHILKLVGRDELRHTQFAYDLLALRIQRDPSESSKVHEAAAIVSAHRAGRRQRDPDRREERVRRDRHDEPEDQAADGRGSADDRMGGGRPCRSGVAFAGG